MTACRYNEWDEDLLREELALEVEHAPRMRPKRVRVFKKAPKVKTNPVSLTQRALDCLRAAGEADARAIGERLGVKPADASGRLQWLVKRGEVERLTPPNHKPATYRAVQ
jgi:hypothetical protein